MVVYTHTKYYKLGDQQKIVGLLFIGAPCRVCLKLYTGAPRIIHIKKLVMYEAT